MQMETYPLGEQDFRELRMRGDIYVDKTGFIPLLLTNKYYFLSRPRRFGKSLFISTLYYFFKGDKDLFRGLAVESMPWDWAEFPVIRIDFSSGSFSRPDGLHARLMKIVRNTEEEYGLEGSGDDPGQRLDSLIVALKNKTGRQVVVLIDEYEKPLLDTVDLPHFENFRSELADFYSVFKSNGANIRLLFITGVTRFGHLNIFSGFNNLTDISLTDFYSTLCGITRDELLGNFRNGIIKLAAKRGLSFDEALEKLAQKYDGYHFSAQLVDVYNPYSLMHCLWESRFSDKWFQSGSSTYLIKRLRENRFDLSKLEGVKVDEDTLLGVDASFANSLTLLYQSGYLTIKAYDPGRDVYTLGLPNQEVAQALYSAIIPYYLGEKFRYDREDSFKLIDLLQEGKAGEAMEELKKYFGSIPYDAKLDYEADFQNLIYAYFSLIGLLSDTVLEKQTSDGRIDMVLEMRKYVYIFEFKRGNDATAALDQINHKEYALQWRGGKKEVIRIGVAFSPESRGIADYRIEK